MKNRLVWTAMMCLCLSTVELIAQDDSVQSNTNDYSIRGVLGGGYSRDVSLFEDVANDLTLNRNQFSVFGRFLWQPGNLLSGGFEVSYMNFYSVKSDLGGQAVRTAVPIYMVFQMSAWEQVDFTVGYGIAILSSVITGGTGSTIESSTISTSVYGSAAYRYPLSDKLDIGGEVRYSIFDHLDDKTLAVSILFSYTFSEY